MLIDLHSKAVGAIVFYGKKLELDRMEIELLNKNKDFVRELGDSARVAN